MKIKYLFIVFFTLATFSCSKENIKVDSDSKSEDSTEIPRQDSSDLKPVTIEKTLFTDAGALRIKKESTIIMDELVNYINHTPRGAEIHISIFLWNYQPLITAINEAYNRGVVIKVLIDVSNSHSKKKNSSVITDLENIFGRPSVVITVNNNITETSINHEKYVLFSKVRLDDGVAKNLVFATSQNFINGASSRTQDAVVMTNKKLYEAFLTHWYDLAKHADKNMKYYEYTVNKIGDSITVFFFPRRKNGKRDGHDPILEILDKLSDYDKDTICILMDGWSGSRGGEIAIKLTTLQTKGVTVQIIASKHNVSDFVKGKLEGVVEAGGYVKYLSKSTVQIHSKTMLIKGVWDGKMQEIILTGSENYYRGGLEYSNNFMLMLKNSVLFKDYRKYFDAFK